MTPLFSIVTPVYKVEEYLPACVDSILAQTFGGFELILVDDGSPDGSGALCDGYAAKDARVRVIHQPNRGVTAARQAALDAARGDYVCFVDGDDWVKENWLETIRRCLTENGGADMLVFDFVTSDGSPDQPLLAAPGYYDKARLEKEIYPYMIWDRRRPFFTQLIPGYQWSKVVRRELILAHGLRDCPIALYEDVAALYECLYNAGSFYVCPEKLYVYRLRSGSALRQYDPEEFRQLKLLRDYLSAHLLRQAPDIADQADAFISSKLLRAIANQLIHRDSLRQAARNIGAALDETGLARQICPQALPLRIRLFLALLRHRAYLAAVLVHRTRVWLYYHRPAALFQKRAAAGGTEGR